MYGNCRMIYLQNHRIIHTHTYIHMLARSPSTQTSTRQATSPLISPIHIIIHSPNMSPAHQPTHLTTHRHANPHPAHVPPLFSLIIQWSNQLFHSTNNSPTQSFSCIHIFSSNHQRQHRFPPEQPKMSNVIPQLIQEGPR